MKNIYMIGDSTMQYNNYNTYPQTGWGQVLHLFAKTDVRIYDYAINGRSTKSFIDEGRFDNVLSKLETGDFVICQFGHNDEKSNDPLRYTTPNGTYIDNLKFFYEEVTKKCCGFILATSISRRKFVDGKCVDTHLGYPQAMLDFAKKNNIVCVDLNQITLDLYNHLGEEATKKFHMIFPKNMYPNYLDGKDDSSHLRYEGAYLIAELFVKNLKNFDTSLNDWFYDINERQEVDLAMLID